MWDWLRLEDWYGIGLGLLLVLAGLSGGPVYSQYGVRFLQKPLEEDGAKLVRALFVVAGIIVAGVSMYLAL